jgi:putative flavoprotein involved in K+ transport
MSATRESEYVDTTVIGGGQAGLSVGYHLRKLGRPFVILDASERIGDAWRNRWDSLRLFTPARYSGLPGVTFPADPHYFPTKDEMADYLESYAREFNLPVRSRMRVDRLSRNGSRFLVEVGEQQLESNNVVVAMGDFQYSKVPSFAEDLDPEIVQLHSSEYKNPSQLRNGSVLLVGAGNSGAEISIEVVRSHPTWVSGRDTGQVPFNIEGLAARLFLVRFVLRFLFHRVITIRTPIGRKLRPKILSMGGPLIRTKRRHMAEAGVEFVPRVTGVKDGLPVLEDGRTLEVANAIWCTGYHPGFSWIDLPIHGEREPLHVGGNVPSQPGLYFVGLHFLYALSSEMIHGVQRDAERIVAEIAERPEVSPSASLPARAEIAV